MIGYRTKALSILRLNMVNSTLLFLLAVSVLVGIFFFVRQEYYPLKFDSPQNVVREPSVFHLDEPVVVEATFLNGDEEVVTFGGAVHWQLIAPNTDLLPSGTEIIQFRFTSTIAPGCREFRFENSPPPSVVDTTRRLFRDGHATVTWKLTGDNIILEPKPGASVRFEVEQFDYVPDDRQLPKHENKMDDTTCEDL